MSKILKVRNVNDYSRHLGCAGQHPLVSVIDYVEVSPIRHSLNNYSVFALFLRDDADVDLDYGCGKYDYNKVRCSASLPDRSEARRTTANVCTSQDGHFFSTPTCCTASRWKNVSEITRFSITVSMRLSI